MPYATLNSAARSQSALKFDTLLDLLVISFDLFFFLFFSSLCFVFFSIVYFGVL